MGMRSMVKHRCFRGLVSIGRQVLRTVAIEEGVWMEMTR